MHRAFLIFHRWLALAASVFIVVIALSGALLTLEGPVARAAAPHVTPTGPSLSLETLAARVRAASGGGPPEFVGMSDASDVAWSVVLLPDSRDEPSVQVTIDQYSGAIVHAPDEPDAAVAFLRQVHLLHTRLLGGATGRVVVASFTIAALVLVITGLVVWWRDKLWRVRLTASWKRINFDLHHSVGVFSAVIALVIIATGIWVHFDAIDNVMRMLNRSPSPTAPPKQPPATPGTPVLSLDAIALVARTAVPGAAIMNIQLPPSPAVPAMVQLKYPEDRTPAGRSRVWIDKYRGTVLLATSTRTASLGQHMIDIKRSLHTGDIFGLPTQILWALASVMLAMQAVTGVLMWLNAWPARRGRRRRAVEIADTVSDRTHPR
jgi:uncharacterized iron-regulated membrane protein